MRSLVTMGMRWTVPLSRHGVCSQDNDHGHRRQHRPLNAERHSHRFRHGGLSASAWRSGSAIPYLFSRLLKHITTDVTVVVVVEVLLSVLRCHLTY